MSPYDKEDNGFNLRSHVEIAHSGVRTSILQFWYQENTRLSFTSTSQTVIISHLMDAEQNQTHHEC